MGRRTILLIVAAVVAVLGAGMVFLYVQGADDRAQAEQAPVEVLKAIAQIEPGETLADAQAAGKLELQAVPERAGARRCPDLGRRPRRAGRASSDLPRRAGHRRRSSAAPASRTS